MTKVYGARDSVEAQFVKGLLEAEEIPAIIQGGPLQAVLGEIPVSPELLPTVSVDEKDLDRAMEIIDELNKGGPAATSPEPSWTCPKCGEVLEGQFSECWNCGSKRGSWGCSTRHAPARTIPILVNSLLAFTLARIECGYDT
jgi:hypothetical protein